MSADPKQVMRVLDYRGIDVRLEDGCLIARSRYGTVPEDMKRFVRHFKDVIIQQLSDTSVRDHRNEAA